MTEYPTQGRAGSGVVTMKLPKESRGVAAAVIGKLDDKIIVLTSKNHPKSILLKAAPSGRRDKRADIVISLTSKEEIVGVVATQAQAANGHAKPEAPSAEAKPKATANGKADGALPMSANGTEPKAKASANGKEPKPA
jgi:DNA gyrase/topoisomerase IV subunit A